MSRIGQVLAEEESIVLCYAFGSYPRGEATPLSDLDLGLVVSEETPVNQYTELVFRLTSKIGGLVENIEADIRILNGAPPELRYSAVAKGVMILCKNERARIRFETDAVTEYLDFKPALDTYYRYLHRRLEETGRL